MGKTRGWQPKKFEVVGQFGEPTGPKMEALPHPNTVNTHWTRIAEALRDNPNRWMLLAKFDPADFGDTTYEIRTAVSTLKSRLLRGEIKSFEKIRMALDTYEVDVREPVPGEFHVYAQLRRAV